MILMDDKIRSITKFSKTLLYLLIYYNSKRVIQRVVHKGLYEWHFTTGCWLYNRLKSVYGPLMSSQLTEPSVQRAAD